MLCAEWVSPRDVILSSCRVRYFKDNTIYATKLPNTFLISKYKNKKKKDKGTKLTEDEEYDIMTDVRECIYKII